MPLPTWIGARDLEKLHKGGQMYPIYPEILNHKILMLDSGWTKTHGHFIQMGGFMLFEGDNPKGVMTPSVVPGFGMCHYVMLYTLVPPYHGSLGS